MSIDFVAFRWMFLLTTTYAVEISVSVGVGGCGYPIYSKVLRTGTAYLVLMKIAPNLDLAGNYIIDLMI